MEQIKAMIGHECGPLEMEQSKGMNGQEHAFSIFERACAVLIRKNHLQEGKITLLQRVWFAPMTA